MLSQSCSSLPNVCSTLHLFALETVAISAFIRLIGATRLSTNDTISDAANSDVCANSVGGLLLGVIEIFAKAYISTQLSDAVVFAVLIVVLLVKPTGLLGKKVSEKV